VSRAPQSRAEPTNKARRPLIRVSHQGACLGCICVAGAVVAVIVSFSFRMYEKLGF
jgi:hypothetical protein